MSLNKTFTNYLVLENRSQLKDFDYKEALKLAKKALEHSPESTEATMQLGFTHFIMQNYEKAEYYLKKANSKKTEDLIKLVEPLSKKGKASPEDLIHIINRVHNTRAHLLFYLVHYDTNHRPAAAHAKVVEALFRTLNKNKVKEFSYDPKQRTLKIIGSDLRFRSNVLLNSQYLSFLASLPIKKLVVTDHPKHRTTNNNPAPDIDCEVVFLPATS